MQDLLGAPGLGSATSSQAVSRRSSAVNQSLQAVQLRLQQLLKTSWLGGMGSRVRRELEEILLLVQQAESVEEAEVVSDTSSRRRSNLLTVSPELLLNRRNTPLLSLRDGGENDGVAEFLMSKTMTESRRWLVETFTTEHVDVQNSSSDEDDDDRDDGEEGMLSMCSVATRRRNTHHIRNYIDAAISDPLVEPFLARDAELDFDALDFAQLRPINNHPLQCIGAHLVNSGLVGTLEGMLHCEGPRFEVTLVRYLGHIDELYRPSVPYHSAAHAADVLMTMRWFMKSSFFQEQMSPMDRFLCMVAAAIHDVGHPGRNNEFMKKTSPLAQAYFEDAVLEHMHLSVAFEAMSKHPELNWLGLLSRKSECKFPGHDNLQNYTRRGLIEMVLATDMAKHDHHMRKLQALVEEFQDDGSQPRQVPEWLVIDRKFFIMSEVLHAADISNPVKPRPVMLKWTERVLEEFWAQGDEEKLLGLDISPLCDRESGARSVPKGQVGFINFVVLPFYHVIAKLVPEAEEALDELNKNLEFWKEQDTIKAELSALFPPRAA